MHVSKYLDVRVFNTSFSSDPLNHLFINAPGTRSASYKDCHRIICIIFSFILLRSQSFIFSLEAVMGVEPTCFQLRVNAAVRSCVRYTAIYLFIYNIFCFTTSTTSSCIPKIVVFITSFLTTFLYGHWKYSVICVPAMMKIYTFGFFVRTREYFF